MTTFLLLTVNTELSSTKKVSIISSSLVGIYTCFIYIAKILAKLSVIHCYLGSCKGKPKKVFWLFTLLASIIALHVEHLKILDDGLSDLELHLLQIYHVVMFRIISRGKKNFFATNSESLCLDGLVTLSEGVIVEDGVVVRPTPSLHWHW